MDIDCNRIARVHSHVVTIMLLRFSVRILYTLGRLVGLMLLVSLIYARYFNVTERCC